MPCMDPPGDPNGRDLWQLVPHFTDQEKSVIGRCPNISMPCNYNPPGGGPPIDLWKKADEGGTAEYRNGQWVCPGNKPQSQASGSYYCCPSGWKLVPYGDTQPCKGNDADLKTCGPLPVGATHQDAVCCSNTKEWVPAMPDGSDPCVIAAPPGQAVPGRPETILAPDIIVPQSAKSDSNILVYLGIGFAVLTGITLIVKMRS